MRHVWLAISVFVGLVYISSGVWSPATSEAQSNTQPAALVLAGSDSPPTTTAAAYAVIDMETGGLLLTQQAERVLPIASITKLFTAVAVYDTYSLDATVTVEAADLTAYGSAGKLQAGQEYTYRELLFPLLLSSSNDAAYTLRRQGAGDTLLATMAQAARRGGAPTAQFADASGLADENQASAAELAHWLQTTYQTHPAVYDMTRVTNYVGPYLGWQNNSPFRNSAGYRGGKHGYTAAAGRTAATVFAETVGDEQRELGYVVLGSADVTQDVATLRAHVQRSVEWQ